MNAAQAHAAPSPASWQRQHAGTLGVWIFLATELMFFGPLFFGYTYGRMHFPQAFAEASRHTDALLGTLNTAILLSSSLTMALAVQARRFDLGRAAMWLLWSTALLGAVFLAVKGFEYAQEWREHLFPGAGFSFSGASAGGARFFFILYFAMTALHALHLAVGIALVGVFAAALGRRRHEFARHERIELAGLYWHFVDMVWIFLYPILYLVGRAAA
jgi:cytochrome c oxidase subunit 3